MTSKKRQSTQTLLKIEAMKACGYQLVEKPKGRFTASKQFGAGTTSHEAWGLAWNHAYQDRQVLKWITTPPEERTKEPK